MTVTPSPQSVVAELLEHSVTHYGHPKDETCGVGLLHAQARALLAAPSSLAGGWRSPTEVPEAKKGEHAYRIVAVKRADGEKVVTFSAFYMNAVPLWFEDDNESRNVTGWHSDSEGDDGPTYSPLLMGGDVLMGWREFPQWEAALSPEAPAREGVQWQRLGVALPEYGRPLLIAHKRDGEDFWRVRDAHLYRRYEGVFASLDHLKGGEFAKDWWFDSIYPGKGDLRLAHEDLLWSYMPEPDAAALTPRHEAPASAIDDLVDRFAVALKEKLRAAEAKYGHDDAWLRDDWRDDLIRQLGEHVQKGDPRDVAAYCAFAWHHGWSVGPFSVSGENDEAPAEGAGEAIERIQSAISDLQAEHEVMKGPFDPEKWAVDVKVSDLLLLLRARSSAPEALGNLLAVIHRDGGQRTLVVGVEQAAAEAEKIVANLLSSAPEAREGEAFPEIEPLFWAWLKERDLCPDGDVVEWQDIIVALDEHEIEIMAAPSADKLRDVLIDLTSWFTKPVQGQNGMVWVIRAGERGADDALNAALAALKAEV